LINIIEREFKLLKKKGLQNYSEKEREEMVESRIKVFA
jgi:hypothetical protein